jgi:hypothetical protein
MKKQIVIATITLGLALVPASVSWPQTSGTDASVSGSSKMGPARPLGALRRFFLM